MPTVLVLQHDANEPLGTLGDALDAARVTPRYVRCDLGEPVPAGLSGADGLIVMGGPMGVYEQDKHPHLAEELALIRRVHADGQPILGLCLGSQLLAAALGADVAPSGDPEIGWYPVTLTDAAAEDPLWAGVAPVWTGLCWHGDVHGLPAGAIRLASSAMTPNQAFRAGPCAYGFQFHMEVTPAVVEDWLSTLATPPGGGVQTPAQLLAGTEIHLPAMRSLALKVFTRWARLVAAR